MERAAGAQGGPAWLTGPLAAGDWRDLGLPLPSLRAEISARIWSPAEPARRILVVHDGPDYDRHAALSRYAAASIAGGVLPPFHLVLLPAGERLAWYAASPAYARALAFDVLPELAAELGGAHQVVGVGASLGALALLHAQRRHPGGFAGLFLQSGSYFQPGLDRQEAGFARWLPIVRFTGQVLRATGGPAVPATLTCGVAEENRANNRAMAAALRAQGYWVTFAETAGGHDWIAWRDAFDPHLTSLLQRVWAS
jgi:enterochelin esterase-like enzyme